MPEGETDSKAGEGVASLGERGAGTPGRTQGKIFTEIGFWNVELLNQLCLRYGGPRFGRAVSKSSDDDRWDTVTFSDMILLAGDAEAKNNDYNESR